MPRIENPGTEESTIMGWQLADIVMNPPFPRFRPKHQAFDRFGGYCGRLPYRETLNTSQLYTEHSRQSYLKHIKKTMDTLPKDTTLQIRWRISKEVPAFSMDFLQLYLSRFGKIDAIYQQAINSCLVVFRKEQSARLVANNRQLGLPYGRLYTKWWHPKPQDLSHCRSMKHLEQVAMSKARFNSLLDKDDRIAVVDPLRSYTRSIAECNKFGGPCLKAYLCKAVKFAEFKKATASAAKEEKPKVTTLVTLNDFHNFISSQKKLVVIDFSATWCGPCKVIEPEFEKMAVEFPDVVFAKIDVDENEEAAGECMISAMPTFQFFRNGMKTDQIIGAMPTELRRKLSQLK